MEVGICKQWGVLALGTNLTPEKHHLIGLNFRRRTGVESARVLHQGRFITFMSLANQYNHHQIAQQVTHRYFVAPRATVRCPNPLP